MKLERPAMLLVAIAFASPSVYANTIDNLVANFVQHVEQRDCSVDLSDLETSQSISQSLGIRVRPTLHLMKDYLITQGTIQAQETEDKILAKTPLCGGDKVVPKPTESLKKVLLESGKCSLNKKEFKTLLKASNIGSWEGSGALNALTKTGDVVQDKQADVMNIKFGQCS
ncbi:hypothetical protein CW749_01925 [Vibrio sp. vnigr-6D03]|uniref:hypothetical protein n=1 Tax=Vibrio sp. vnigr-6D03 TaxID=2058088 RepID=UPI000C329CAF|nr:hypothetical protein [Vibrio sp. vnigr-6D03]PKF81423.1 hypothetical protein CW749_01925 [Vibrio sp. vnigr-6D03]